LFTLITLRKHLVCYCLDIGQQYSDASNFVTEWNLFESKAE